MIFGLTKHQKIQRQREMDIGKIDMYKSVVCRSILKVGFHTAAF